MDEREVIIEPFHGQWLAFYPGERQHRVFADTPDLARELLAESQRQQNESAMRPPFGHSVAVAVCLMVTVIAGWMIAFHKPAAPAVPVISAAAHHQIQWAHHRSHSQ